MNSNGEYGTIIGSPAAYPHLNYDDLGMVAMDPGQCFICQRLTFRIDICFETYFCNHKGCNDAIEKELERLE